MDKFVIRKRKYDSADSNAGPLQIQNASGGRNQQSDMSSKIIALVKIQLHRECEIDNVPMDGNCLFSSLALQQGNRSHNAAAKIRAELVDYIKQNPDMVSEVLSRSQIDDYLEHMQCDAYYGDGVMLSAAVKFYGRPIVIVSADNNAIEHIDTASPSIMKPMYLGLFREHYVSIRMLEDDSALLVASCMTGNTALSKLTADADSTVVNSSNCCSTKQSPTEESSCVVPPSESMNDIGFLYENDQLQRSRISLLSDADKCCLLREHWLPPTEFAWPFYQKRNQRVFLRENHITGPKYGCFKFSRGLSGIVCVPCALFTADCSTNDRGKATTLGQLVQTPLRNYRCLTGKDSSLDSHLQTQYHKTAQLRADNLLAMAHTMKTIACQLDDQHAQHLKEQRERLVPIIKTIILCARMGIAYRGHRDDGSLDVDQPFACGDGNFRALLKFRIDAGDKILENHLLTAGRNATYISKISQNQLINICGDLIVDSIVAGITNAKYFTIMCDETTDSSHKEQMCLCVRFIDNASGHHRIREDFLNFQSADDLCAAGLFNQIMNTLTSLKLDLKNLVGQAYDGATTMSGHVSGVQTRIREAAPLATYVHCSSHVLNLVLNTGSSVPEIRNMFTTVKAVTNFINESSKRRKMFQDTLGEEGGRALMTLCETRFIERHDALVVFAEHFSKTLEALDAIAMQCQDRKAVDTARALSSAMCDASFIVSLCCARKVMAVTMVLSRSLQKINQDLFDATHSVDYVTKTLKRWRNNDSDEQHQEQEDEERHVWHHEQFGVFSTAEALAKTADITLKIPRLCHRQSKRNNIHADSPSQYFQRAIWFPYLDTIIQNMQDKFAAHHMTVLRLVALIPSVVDLYRWSDVSDSVRFYQSELASEEEVLHEYNQWKDFCMTMNKSDRPSTPLLALDIVPCRLPNIKCLLHIFCTLPVTTCTPERAFSAMKLIKNYLRNTMTDERLSALALMYIHPQIDINNEEVINRFLDKPIKRKLLQ